MYELISRAGKYTAAVLLILIALAACAAPAVKPRPVSPPPPPAVSQPEIMNIIGAQEWNPGKENTLFCAARDPDGNPLTYVWTAENGTITGDGQKVTWLPPDTTGDYEISVKVDNGKGGEASFSKRFSVTNPPPPEPDKTIYLKMSVPSTTTTVTQGRVRAFFVIEVQCVMEGADPKDFTYTWGVTGGKLMADGLEDGKASRVGWLAPGSGGQYKIAVLVQDKSGNQAAGEVDMEVLCCRDP
ncbi:MAG: PKD domain-containing protein [Chloroflexi bacterium]|nr:PKD domain-containing protein [Chloroflexota bacterium]